VKDSLLPKLLDVLRPKKIAENHYVGQNLQIGSLAVYGGQVLAQAVSVAYETTPDNLNIHSLHAYFLRMGDNHQEIEYQVDVIRDGGSFSTRRVSAIQKNKIIFILAASFHKNEEGLDHQSSMPNVAQPESLTSFSDLFAKFAEEFDVKPKGFYSEESPVLFHPIEHFNPFNPGIRPPNHHVWFKANGTLPEDKAIQRSFLSYVSDYSLLITALLPHDVTFFTAPMKIASLDHAMWFHRDFDANDWMLYVVDSPTANGARGFCNGKMYNREGNLVASVAQEGLIRIIK